jgi:hypothetical protein
MSDNPTKQKRTTKTRSYSIRFSKTFFESICAEHGFEKAQEIIDHFELQYLLSKSPVSAAPTYLRNVQKPEIKKENVQKNTHPRKFDCPEMSLEDAERIAFLQREIEKGAPKELSALAKRTYFHDRNKEINTIREKYNC